MAYYTPLIVLVWLALLVLCILVKENAGTACVYTVFVRKRDLARAKEICEIG